MQANAPFAPERTFERIAVVRDLTGRKVPVAIVHAFAPGGAELAMVERYAPSASLDAAALDVLEKDARTTMSLRHPNLAPVRDVWREDGELRIAFELIEGETLEELRKLAVSGKELSIEVGVRIVVDVLAALSALHALGGGGLAHGEVTATNVIVGFDGATRLARPFRGHVAGKVAEPDWFSYAAPEALRGGAADARGDLFAVGVLLWETLTRRKLFPKATREGRIARNIPIGKPQPPPDATWAAPLGAVAERALANDPGARYSTAAEMAAAVRLAVRSKLAMPPRVAGVVDKLASTRILERRTANALPEPSGSLRPSLRPSVPDEAVRALAAMRPSSRPPTPKPPPVAMPVVPRAAPLPVIESAAWATEPPTAKVTPHPPKPRPFAPVLKLATPAPFVPKQPEPVAVEEAAPISIDAVFPESADEKRRALIAEDNEAPPLPPVPVTPQPVHAEPVIQVPGLERSNRRMLAIVAGGVLLLLVALAAVLSGVASGGKPSTPRTMDSAREPVTMTANTQTATTQPAVTAAPSTTTAAPSQSAVIPDTSSTVDPPSATAPSTEPRRPHTRPRPTYDPMGI